MQATLALTAVLIMSGCVAVPVGPAYAYDQGGYYAPAPGYYYAPAPYVYGPSLSIGIFGGGGHRFGGGGHRFSGGRHRR
ncbi:MAG: hypothetical protein HY661_10785 [Betaproteobacteria bacterium]|nr:hypothetical protein [Betaproteobacteria bacterium]